VVVRLWYGCCCADVARVEILLLLPQPRFDLDAGGTVPRAQPRRRCTGVAVAVPTASSMRRRRDGAMDTTPAPVSSSIRPHHCELFPSLPLSLCILYSDEFVGQELVCAWPDYCICLGVLFRCYMTCKFVSQVLILVNLCYMLKMGPATTSCYGTTWLAWVISWTLSNSLKLTCMDLVALLWLCRFYAPVWRIHSSRHIFLL
jgi:hypothetical protein